MKKGIIKTKIGLWKGKEIEKLPKKELLEIILFLGKERGKCKCINLFDL